MGSYTRPVVPVSSLGMRVEPVEGVVHDVVDDGDVFDAGELDVFDVHAEVLGGSVEGAGDGHEGICVASSS